MAAFDPGAAQGCRCRQQFETRHDDVLDGFERVALAAALQTRRRCRNGLGFMTGGMRWSFLTCQVQQQQRTQQASKYIQKKPTDIHRLPKKNGKKKTPNNSSNNQNRKSVQKIFGALGESNSRPLAFSDDHQYGFPLLTAGFSPEASIIPLDQRPEYNLYVAANKNMNLRVKYVPSAIQ